MKNIHVLPTDKPSRLFLNRLNNKILLEDIVNPSLKNVLPSGSYQNIYITSNEEIKEGDWHLSFLRDKFEVINYLPNGGYRKECLGKEVCKIILTTDQDLIKDGVQAIDDEFLEWFVKNPSCEWVEVEKESNIEIVEISYEGDFQNVEYINYKIIIPKEEPKQICEYCKIEITKYGCGCGTKEPKQDLEKEMFELEQELDIPSHLRWHNSKPKQETSLEEAAEREASLFYEKGSLDWNKYRQVFIEGAKWQAERMYSEEEVIQLLIIKPNLKNDQEVNQWFEKFKKK